MVVVTRRTPWGAALGFGIGGFVSVKGVLAPRVSNTVAARLGGSSWVISRIVGEKWGSGVSEFVATAREFEVSVYTGSEEGFHVVGDHFDCTARKSDLANFVTASQVHPERCGRFDLEAFRNKGPSLIEIEPRARKLEVINIDDE